MFLPNTSFQNIPSSSYPLKGFITLKAGGRHTGDDFFISLITVHVAFTIMASLSFLLGMVPTTEKVESADDQLRADFQAYKDFESSDEFKHYLELEKEVKSSDFALRKKKHKRSEYKDSEEYQKETEYGVYIDQESLGHEMMHVLNIMSDDRVLNPDDLGNFGL